MTRSISSPIKGYMTARPIRQLMHIPKVKCMLIVKRSRTLLCGIFCIQRSSSFFGKIFLCEMDSVRAVCHSGYDLPQCLSADITHGEHTVNIRAG